MSTIGTTLFSKIEINGQEVDIATLDANDGIYALPAGYTTANVKFTMIDNTSIPRGVFEENSYITAMTLPDAMTYIASYSFHGVNNINISDKNAILAINPYAFDAEPTPPGPEPKTDPDLHYVGGNGNYDLYTHVETIPALQNTYNVSPISYFSSDTAVATVNPDGIINYLAVGNTIITASFAGDTTYEADTTSFTLTVSDSTPSTTDPDIYFMSPTLTVDYNMEPNKLNGNEITQYLSGSNSTDGAWIVWSTDNSSIATVNHGGYVIANGNGTVNIIAEYTAHDNYNSKTVQYQLTITNYSGGGGGKQYPTGGWYENSSQVWNLDLVEGSIDAHDLTFDGIPGDSWTFSYMSLPTGITLDSSTGEITVQYDALATAGEYYINANRMEDSSYYSAMASLTIKVFPAGTDLNFHFDQQSVNLDNTGMSTQTPILTDYTGIDTTLYPIQYVSGDTNVATVDTYGTISFVGAGNTTVTATLSDGNETHTATITVYCTVYKQMPYATWIDPSTQMTSTMITCTNGTTIDFNGTPLSGWTFTPSDPAIIINAGNQVVVDSGTSGQTYTVSASYTEDATYYAGSGTLTITIS